MQIQLKARTINVDHTQLNKLSKCMPTNSQLCPFGGRPAIEPPIKCSRTCCQADSSVKKPQRGCQEMFMKYLHEDFAGLCGGLLG